GVAAQPVHRTCLLRSRAHEFRVTAFVREQRSVHTGLLQAGVVPGAPCHTEVTPGPRQVSIGAQPMSCACTVCKANVLVRYHARVIGTLLVIFREVDTLQAEDEVSIPGLEPVVDVKVVSLNL